MDMQLRRDAAEGKVSIADQSRIMLMSVAWCGCALPQVMSAILDLESKLLQALQVLLSLLLIRFYALCSCQAENEAIGVALRRSA